MGSGITFSKKADFALCFSIRHAEVKPYYRKLCYLDRCYLLSQMSDESTSRMSLFCGLEVKSQKDANYDEALAQLGIWIGAGLRKSEQLGLHAEESSMEPEDLNIQEENVSIFTFRINSSHTGGIVSTLWAWLNRFTSRETRSQCMLPSNR